MRLIPLLWRPRFRWPVWTASDCGDGARWAVLAVLLIVNWSGARPYPDSAHERTRLAAIESIAKRNSFRIDGSAYLHQTIDKFYSRGHYYSHHPPVPLYLIGGVYKMWLAIGGPDPAIKPDRFEKGMTRLTAVLPAVLAVAVIGLLARRAVGVSAAGACVIVVLLGFGTMLPAYTRHTNGHAPTLLTTAGVCYALAMIMAHGPSRRRLILLGACIGATYVQDSVIGGACGLTAVAALLVMGQWRSIRGVILTAIPWALAHHYLLYSITGSLSSPATNPALWTWPGCPFTAESLTGTGFKHTPTGAVEYAFEMLGGPRGFLIHNPPALAAIGLAVAVIIRGGPGRWMAVAALGLAGVAVVPYVLLSNNLSGLCLSIRWFLPLLAPAGWALAVAVREWPRLVIGFLAMLPASGLMAWPMYRLGPWTGHPVPNLDALCASALACGGVAWAVAGVWDRMRSTPPS